MPTLLAVPPHHARKVQLPNVYIFGNTTDWFNTRRLLEAIGYLPPAEYEARYYEQAAVA